MELEEGREREKRKSGWDQGEQRDHVRANDLVGHRWVATTSLDTKSYSHLATVISCLFFPSLSLSLSLSLSN